MSINLAKNEITIDVIKKLIHADFESGKMFWKPRGLDWYYDERGESYAVAKMKRFETRCSGKEALNTLDSRGFKRGHILRNYFKAHRVIFAMRWGYWPKQIDHKNGDNSDNRISNLIECDTIMNNRNRKMFATNTSGCTGVRKMKNGTYSIQIGNGDGRDYVNNISSFDKAVAIRRKKEIELGYSNRHGV